MLDDIEICGDEYGCRSLSFANVEFKGAVGLVDVNLQTGISFTNCHFDKRVDLVVIKTEINVKLIHNFFERIRFTKCIFGNDFTLGTSGELVKRNVELVECTCNGQVSISNLNIDGCQLLIIDSKFNGWFTIDKVCAQQLSLTNTTVGAKMLLKGNRFHIAHLLDCYFAKELFFVENYFEHQFGLNRSEFQSVVNFNKNYGGGLSFYKSQFKDNVSVDISYDLESVDPPSPCFKILGIDESGFSNGIIITGKSFVFLETAQIETINITCSPSLHGDINIEELVVRDMTIKGVNTRANIFLSNVEINHVKCENFYNQAQFIFSNVRASTLGSLCNNDAEAIQWPMEFNISFSNLGKAHFYMVDFSLYDKITLHSVVLTDVIISCVKWFDDKSLDVLEENESSNFNSRREIYRQLKYAMEKNSDRPQSLAFQSLEMNYYRKYLNLMAKSNYKDRFILWTGQSNDFGQDWWKATWIYIRLLLVFYLPYAFYISNLTVMPSVIEEVKQAGIALWDNLRLLTILSNPAHDLSKILNDPPGIFYFWDMLLRLVTAYFIFQIVSAFRKYVK